MTVYANTPHYTYFQAEIKTKTPFLISYFFECQQPNKTPIYLFTQSNIFNQPFVYLWKQSDIITIPDWIYHAIAYQIFPDRFYNGNPTNDPNNILQWGGTPTYDNFFGGDLPGIVAKIPYLQSLGINSIWLNPVFASSSNHRYNTRDYLTIDPALGSLDDLRNLMKVLHQAGMHLILDGVFNHTGTDFFAFKDILENGANSRYKDWYYVYQFPIQMEPKPNYACWWGIPGLPKLNVTNPEVRNYLLNVSIYWPRETGIDGWRLDVPNEIEPSFWQEFRQLLKENYPDSYIVGEIWHDARFWLNQGYFDGVMNYLFRDLIIDYFAKRRITLSKLDFLLGRIRLRYPETSNYALLNLLDSHDTARIISTFQEELSRRHDHTGSYHEAINHLRPALIIQFTYPGIPLTYYGDEVGMTGGPDPDCRRTMPWEPETINQVLLSFYRRLIAIRNQRDSLRRGYFQPLLTDDLAEIYGFLRYYDEEKTIIIINASDHKQNIQLDIADLNLDQNKPLQEWLSDFKYQITNNRLTLSVEANYGVILYQN